MRSLCVAHAVMQIRRYRMGSGITAAAVCARGMLTKRHLAIGARDVAA